MKKIFYLSFLCIAFTTVFSSCSDRKTYAQRLKEEDKLIKNYIDRNGIKVLNQFPADSVFKEKEFVKLPSGVYFRLQKKGVGDLNVKEGDKVIVKYIEYTLTTDADITNHWDTNLSPYIQPFSYLRLNESSRAFHEAVGLMKKNEAEAQLIVPSKLGFDEDRTGNELTPHAYNLQLTLRNNEIPNK